MCTRPGISHMEAQLVKSLLPNSLKLLAEYSALSAVNLGLSTCWLLMGSYSQFLGKWPSPIWPLLHQRMCTEKPIESAWKSKSQSFITHSQEWHLLNIAHIPSVRNNLLMRKELTRTSIPGSRHLKSYFTHKPSRFSYLGLMRQEMTQQVL